MLKNILKITLAVGRHCSGKLHTRPRGFDKVRLILTCDERIYLSYSDVRCSCSLLLKIVLCSPSAALC